MRREGGGGGGTKKPFGLKWGWHLSPILNNMPKKYTTTYKSGVPRKPTNIPCDTTDSADIVVSNEIKANQDNMSRVYMDYTSKCVVFVLNNIRKNPFPLA